MKTENMWFDDIFFADSIFDHFVTVYIKIIIDFKNFLLAFPW